jgi:membrane-associated phospholipid phosphatase
MQFRSYLRSLSFSGALLVCSAWPVLAQKSVFGMIGKDLENAGRDVLAVWTSPFDARPNDYLSTVFLIGSAVAISPIDDDVDRWAVRNANSSLFDALEPFRKGGSLYGGGRLVPAVGALYVAGIITKKQGLRDAVTGCGATWASNHVFRRYVLYQLVGRERPDPTRGENPPPAAEPGEQYRFDIPNDGDWGWNSFPGGHIANIAGCASFFNNRFKMGFVEPVLYAVAGAIWIARTADRAHWQSDQLLGTVMGYAIGKEVAHRQLKREAARAAATANGTSGAATSPADGLYYVKRGDVVRLGWQLSF